ncbi:Kbarr-1 killer toxin [Torulaspora delbrueckii dsRNA Mbarr-1 killer virus]|uniref:Kbarr-1 killer toxin n=1 Tax=Torulaspora delbrueckii dsRNA Mbarr-1 killer virus TaxID=1736634 RepID=UPI0006D552FD|nr:Kbarr-1 killer toxin [Torulaspora delbrueckii dsRNA Mbarr-1 killer virus]ALI93476.1 Kbarr-1 killer toxin [Torulaspora delbrueckii dsRNA Mbarr-1 killer virus]
MKTNLFMVAAIVFFLRLTNVNASQEQDDSAFDSRIINSVISELRGKIDGCEILVDSSGTLVLLPISEEAEFSWEDSEHAMSIIDVLTKYNIRTEISDSRAANRAGNLGNNVTLLDPDDAFSAGIRLVRLPHVPVRQGVTTPAVRNNTYRTRSTATIEASHDNADNLRRLSRRAQWFSPLGVDGYWDKNCPGDEQGYSQDTADPGCSNYASTSYMKSTLTHNWCRYRPAGISIWPHHNCQSGGKIHTLWAQDVAQAVSTRTLIHGNNQSPMQ